MNVLICPTVCQLDREISEKLNGLGTEGMWTPERVANYRGLLFDYNRQITDEDTVESAIGKILSFKHTSEFYTQLRSSKFKEVQEFFNSKDRKKSFSEAFTQAKSVYESETLHKRVQWVAQLFSNAVSNAQKKLNEIDSENDYDRTAVCEGVKIGERVYGGQSSIFSYIYKQIVLRYLGSQKNKQFLENKTELSEKEELDLLFFQHEEKELEKILENWSVIQTLARVQLRITEKLKLGNTVEYVENAEEYNENYNIQDFNIEEATRDSFNNQKDKLSAFGSLSAEVRRVLSTLPSYTDGKKIELDDLGNIVYLNPIEAHQKLSSLLRGSFRYKTVLNKLEKYSKDHPWVLPVIQELKNNKEFRQQFVINMHKGFQVYSGIILDLNNGLKQFKTKVLNKHENDTFNNFKALIFTGNGLSREQLQSNLAKESVIGRTAQALADSNLYKRPISNADKCTYIKTVYNSLGIDVSLEEAFNIAEGRGWTVFSNTVRSYNNVKSYLESSKSKLYDTLTKKKPNYYGDVNPLHEFIHKLTNILDSTKELVYERRVSFKDSKGKTASFDSLVESSYMTDVFDTIEMYIDENDSKGLKEWLTNKFFICPYFYKNEGNLKNINPDKILHPWLKDLYLDASNGFPEGGFASQFSFERFLGNLSTNNEFENFTSKEHIVTNIQMFERLRQISKESNYAHYPVFILGDSGIAKFITGKVHTVAKSTKEGGTEIQDDAKKEILKQYFNVYQSEIERRKLFIATSDRCKKEKINTKYSFIEKAEKLEKDNKFEFSILTFLNDEKYTKKQERENYNVFTLTEDKFYEILEEYMSDQIVTFKDNLQKYDCLETQVINNVTYYKDLGIKKDDFDAFVTNFYWNQKLAMISQLQFFTIDPVFYPDTKEIQKRYKEIHASGIPLNLDVLEEGESDYETCLYFEDVNVGGDADYADMNNALAYHFGLEALGKKISETTKEEIIQAGKETYKYSKYKKNSLTDGQGWRTLDSYKKVSRMAGTWTNKHQKAYNKIKELQKKENKTAADIAEIARLAVVFQPIKPFTYTHEKFGLNNNENLLIPVQHKYSEAVLIPELLPDGMLKDVATYMQENNIDVFASTKCVKVGCFGQTNVQYETDENFNIIEKDGVKQKIQTKEGLYKALSKGYIHKISYADYRIQTNVPLHLNEEALFGTQIRKLVMSNMNMTPGHYYNYTKGNAIKLYKNGNPVNLTGPNLLSWYNALIISNILETFDTFTQNIKDGKRLSEMFIQNVISNGREALDNIFVYSITEDESFILPLFEGALEHDASATLFSLFKKAVNKQKIKGGSAVQVSSLGIEGYETDGNLKYVLDPNDSENILYAEAEIPFNLSYTTYNGEEIHLKYENYCNADGTLILDTSKELIEPEEYKMYQSYYIIDENGNKHYYKPKIEVEYPDILSVIAYRIPTERAYSMINIRVKRFSPLISGGTIKVPAQGTTIAGFDFDIDKLYLMFKQFKENKSFFESLDLTYEQKIQIFREIHKSNPELVEKIQDYETYFDNAQLGTIFDYYYQDNPQVKEDLKNLRGNSKKHLVTFFAESEEVKRLAKNKGMSVSEYRNWIINTYSEMYGIIPYESFIEDDEAIFKFKDNTTKEQQTNAFRNASEKLGYKYQKKFKIINGKEERFVEYDYSKVPSEQNRVARNNMLLEIMRNRLMDKETFIERYSPGGFPQASDAAKLIRYLDFSEEDFSKLSLQDIKNKIKEDGYKDPEPNYDPTDPMTVVIYNQQNQIASKLIGIFANQNANHAISLYLNKFELKSPIEFFGHSYKNFITPPPGIDVNGTMAEFLAASVDAVKDPTLGYLNLNTLTATAGATLARLGYTMDEIGILFNQPVIKEVCEYAFNNQCSMDTAVEKIKNDYINNKILKPDNIDKINTDLLTEERLIKNMYKKEQDKEEFKKSQAEVLKLFSNILNVSKDVSNYLSTTKYTASNSVGSTFGDFYSQQQKVMEFQNKYSEDSLSFIIQVDARGSISPIDNDPELLKIGKQEYIEYTMQHPFGYEQCMYDMNRKTLKLFSKYYPYENSLYKKLRDAMTGFSRNSSLYPKTINQIHSDFLVYLLSKTKGLFNPETKIHYDNKEFSAEEYYTEVFPKCLLEFQKQLKENSEYYAILSDQHLYFNVSEDNKVSMNIRNVAGLNSIQRDALTRSWEDLQKDYPEVARDLFLYNFYKSGFNFGPYSFMHLAPSTLKQSILVQEENGQEISYIDYLKNILNNNNINVAFEDFARQYILNHTESYEFIETLTENSKKVLKVDETNIPKEIFIDPLTLVKDLEQLITKKTKDSTYVIPCFKYVTKNNKVYFYILEDINTLVEGQTNPSGELVYKLASVQGHTNKDTRYYPDSTSDIKENTDAEGILEPTNGDNDKKIDSFTPEITVQDIKNKIMSDILNGSISIEGTSLNKEQQIALIGSLYTKDDNNIKELKKKKDNREQIIVLDQEGNPTFIC